MLGTGETWKNVDIGHSLLITDEFVVKGIIEKFMYNIVTKNVSVALLGVLCKSNIHNLMKLSLSTCQYI